MRTMRAAVLTAHDLDGVRLREVPVPRPHHDQVLIRVETVAVNQLDLNVISGTGPGIAAQLPRILGLDPAGIVVEVGSGVDASRVGERVVVKPNIPCGHCVRCENGDEADCPAQTILGVHLDGGAAEYVAVPARSAFDRGTLSAEAATAAVHSAPIALNALQTAEVARGERVLVTGAAGTLGRAAAALARHAGARVVTASRSSPDGGVQGIVAPDAGALSERLADEDPFDVVIDVSGHAPTLAAGIRALGWRGRAVFCAASVDVDLAIDARDFYLKRKSLRGVASASYGQVREALRFAQAGVLPDLVGARAELDDIVGAYRRYPLAGGGKSVIRIA